MNASFDSFELAGDKNHHLVIEIAGSNIISESPFFAKTSPVDQEFKYTPMGTLGTPDKV